MSVCCVSHYRLRAVWGRTSEISEAIATLGPAAGWVAAWTRRRRSILTRV